MARTMGAHLRPHGTCAAIDVGKSFHWAYAVNDGWDEVLSRRSRTGRPTSMRRSRRSAGTRSQSSIRRIV